MLLILVGVIDVKLTKEVIAQEEDEGVQVL